MKSDSYCSCGECRWSPNLNITIEVAPDYEPCGECGYDHSYEQEEAKKAHEQSERM